MQKRITYLRNAEVIIKEMLQILQYEIQRVRQKRSTSCNAVR